MIGTRLAHYEITSHLGTGGMGEVYQATDSKLGRSVAIKLLPEAFTHDADRAARFEREARVLASLNHPNIATIYGVEESAGRKFLVMELVPGETLAETIRRGAIPLAESLVLATQIAEALEAAHEKGVIHRDLKPANIKVTPEGKVKVLDFGLAKAYAGEAANASLSNSPTISNMATQQGMILGTAAYMSPEQARGKEVDRRTDIFAFGAVLYEMLTGSPAFGGETVADILSRVLQGEPDWNRLPAQIPSTIRRLMIRCLQKDRHLRLQHAGDARIEINEQIHAPSAAPAAQASTRGERRVWISGMAVVIVLAAAGLFWVRHSDPAARDLAEMRLQINAPPTSAPGSMAISPDGQRVVFVATVEGRSQLVLRRLDSLATQTLSGTDGAQLPFWSPDNRSIGFFADSKLKRINVSDGTLQALAPAQGGQGGDWNSDGVIVFLPRNAGAITRIPAGGGEAKVVVQADAFYSDPSFLPDGKHFVYSVGACLQPPCAVYKRPGVYVSALDGTDTRFVLEDAQQPKYASSGQLLFLRQGKLFAQDFDLSGLVVGGNPTLVADNVLAVSASGTGSFLYRTRLTGQIAHAIWVDRAGKETATVSPNPLQNLVLSSDDHRVAFQDKLDIYLLDTGSGTPTRLTFDPSNDNTPVWSPDGRQVAFASGRGSPEGLKLYVKPASGAGNDEKLLAIERQNLTPMDWSPDGHFLLYRQNSPTTGFDLWALRIDGDRKPFPVVQSPAEDQEGQFSPDGKWIAYQSNESGRFEVFVQAFGGPDAKTGGKWQISTGGGAQVRWRRDGKELFYIALDGRLTAVPIRVTPDGQAIEHDPPVPLFPASVLYGVVTGAPLRQQYAPSRDGQRFLINTLIEQASSPLTLILNWKPPAK